MNQNLSVKRWPSTLIKLDVVPFWVQIRGLPLNLCIVTSARKLAEVVGEFLEVENLELAKGFLRVKISVEMGKSLIMGCWLPRLRGTYSWIEFRYEHLQDFCYKCGKIR